MSSNLLSLIEGIVLDAARKRAQPFQYAGAEMPADAIADPQCCLPLLVCSAAITAQNLGITPPTLNFQADEEASFGVTLTALRAIRQEGAGAYLLTLRDAILNLDPELELIQAALGEYLAAHPAAVTGSAAVASTLVTVPTY